MAVAWPASGSRISTRQTDAERSVPPSDQSSSVYATATRQRVKHMPFHQLADGTTLFFTDTASDGPVLLFVHGWTCDSHDWSWQIPAFTAKFRVVAPDLRGHGRSSVPAGGYTPAGFAADLALLLRALDAAPAVVVGHSLGGAIAAHLAVADPDLVRAIVAVDSAYGPASNDLDPAALFAALRSAQSHDAVASICAGLAGPATPAALLTWHQRRGAGVAPEVIAATSEGLLNEDGGIGPTARFLRQRGVPVLALHREQRSADWEAATLADDGYSEIAVWDDVGHWLQQERPAEFNDLVGSWISRLP